MSVEKKFRKFQKKLSQGRYKKPIRIASGCVALVCAASLAVYFGQGKQTEDEIENLREIKEQAQAKAETTDGGEAADTGEDGGILPQYQELYAMNQDLIGWLTIGGTTVDYPVMWTPQDTEYYSHRGFDGSDSSNGLLFMDGASSVAEEGGNLIIYGHNMKNGSMFADLMEYGKESYYEEHPTIQFDTLYETRTYEVAAVAKTNNIELLPFGYTGADEAKFTQAVEAMEANALYDTGVELNYGDDCLTLATCDYSVDNGRLVVLAKRVE